MGEYSFPRCAARLLLILCAVVLPVLSPAEDIDIFVGSSAGTAANPRILIVLDNTSNWARQSQQWPGGVQQGQSEVRAIMNVVKELDGTVDIGLMEFVTAGNANDDGGFIRYAIQPMIESSRKALSEKLTTIFDNINAPEEKRNSNTPYGNLMYDVYNYYAGADSYSPNGVITGLADDNGYNPKPTRFKSPLSSANSCGRNFIIFIGNPNASGPASDSTANASALAAKGGDTSQLSLPNFTTAQTATTTNVGTTSQCYSGASTCTAAGVGIFAPGLLATCSDSSIYPSGCSCGSALSDSTQICPSGTNYYNLSATVKVLGPTSKCYQDNNGSPKNFPDQHETTTCPSGATCSYAKGSGTNCTANQYRWTVTATYSTPQSTALVSAQCYTSQSACTSQVGADGNATGSTFSGWSCGSSAGNSKSCPSNTSNFTVLGNGFTTTITPTNTYYSDTGPRNADEWSRFLYQHGVPVSDGPTQSITTYTIDVFNAQQNATQTGLLMSMAKAGGGKYFAAKNEESIVAALKEILAEIRSVNSTFASASLPVSATNRTQNANQVFIGMFRPDPDAKPRWFGNLKRYQVGSTGTALDLVGEDGKAVTNLQTGFMLDCALSFWTTDSPTPTDWGNKYYWNSIVVNPPPSSKCLRSPNEWSDKYDGSFVEKGAVAEILRKGNAPPYVDGDSSAPSWEVNRTLYTLSGGSLVTLSGTSMPALGTNALNFTLGRDVNKESPLGGVDTKIARPSIHGDVVHARPLPINYGSDKSVTVYYGSNDGTLRAVDADNGKEVWAFVAPEFAVAGASRSPTGDTDPLTRLMNNSPLVNYPNVDASLNPRPKDYFFDGSIGLYQNADNSNIWIYPTMRRGGREVYAFDVTSRTTPSFMWRLGCPNLTNDTGCSEGFSGMGQTWSTPAVAFVKGYSETDPLLIIGGGYDACEDDDRIDPSCSSPKGAIVYVLDAKTGTLLRSFTTERSVASDIALTDMDGDGMVDYAYAVDTGGSLYRIDFVECVIAASGGCSGYKELHVGDWGRHTVAKTSGAGRKFLFAPAVLANAGKVYVAIGSGDREHPLAAQYPSTEKVLNRFYVYRDDPPKTPDEAIDLDSRLVDYTDLEKVNSVISSKGNSCTATEAFSNEDDGTRGWFVSLQEGEQTVTSAVIVSGLVAFSTNQPVTSTNQCSTMLGRARGYWLNLLNGAGAISGTCTIKGASLTNDTRCSCGGSRSSEFAGGGLPPSPVLATVPVNGKPMTIVIGGAQRDGGKSSSIAPQQAKPTISSTRRTVYRYTQGIDSK